MPKKSFIRIVGIGRFSKKTLLSLFVAYLIIFWGVPLVGFIPHELIRISVANYYTLLFVPVSLLAVGFLVGTEYGFCPVFMLVIFALTIPSAYVYDFSPAWQYGLFYSVVYGAGNCLTEIRRSINEEK